MPTPLSKFLLGTCILSLVASCVPAQLQADIEQQRENNFALQRALANIKLEQQRTASQMENLERTWWSEKLCKNPKNPEFPKRVGEFMNEVQTASAGTCSQGSLENALFFMNTQAYSNCYLRPSDHIDAMHVARKGHLLSLLDPKYIYPSTRLLVLVQPADESDAAREKAKQLGEEYIGLMRRLAPERMLRILGPHLLPCRLRGEVSRRFHSPMDVTLPDEPLEGTPRIRIWAFRTDCS